MPKTSYRSGVSEPADDRYLTAMESRSDRRKRRNRQALIEAGYQVMAQKGIDAATMSRDRRPGRCRRRHGLQLLRLEGRSGDAP